MMRRERPLGIPRISRARSASVSPFGQDPTPSFQAAIIMFCAARPPSKPCRSDSRSITTAAAQPRRFAAV